MITTINLQNSLYVCFEPCLGRCQHLHVLIFGTFRIHVCTFMASAKHERFPPPKIGPLINKCRQGGTDNERDWYIVTARGERKKTRDRIKSFLRNVPLVLTTNTLRNISVSSERRKAPSQPTRCLMRLECIEQSDEGSTGFRKVANVSKLYIDWVPKWQRNWTISQLG